MVQCKWHREATSVSSVTTSGYIALDRFNIDLSSAGTWTISQDTNTPSGFGSSMKFVCTTADASLGSSDRIAFRQYIEGQNVQQLKKGTSDAELVTASFYVKSNKTGTYILEFYDIDNSRHINKSYTVDTANTWEYKTITFECRYYRCCWIMTMLPLLCYISGFRLRFFLFKWYVTNFLGC